MQFKNLIRIGLLCVLSISTLPRIRAQTSGLQPDVVERAWHGVNSGGSNYGDAIEDRRAKAIAVLSNRLMWSSCIFLMTTICLAGWLWFETRRYDRFRDHVGEVLDDALNTAETAHRYAQDAAEANKELAEELAQRAASRAALAATIQAHKNADSKPGVVQQESTVAKQLEASFERERNQRQENTTLRQEIATLKQTNTDLTKAVEDPKKRTGELEKENRNLRQQNQDCQQKLRQLRQSGSGGAAA